jgi:MarR family transcriptional regulator, organic hydroperoxide resistance regulator
MKKRASSMRLDRQLCFALYRASRAVIRAYAPLLEPLRLTYPQYVTLLALWEEDGVSVKRLGERLTLDSATLTPLLKRLEQGHLVERRRDSADQRVVRIHLTRQGRALQARARSVPEAMLCRVGGPGERAALGRLAQLREELEALTQRLDATA